jgi:hypothetical protein
LGSLIDPRRSLVGQGYSRKTAFMIKSTEHFKSVREQVEAQSPDRASGQQSMCASGKVADMRSSKKARRFDHVRSSNVSLKEVKGTCHLQQEREQ